MQKCSPALVLQRFSGGEILTPFLGKIAILKCFFFILLLHFFVGSLADWRRAICRHYFSASAFLHRLIHFMIFHTASFSVTRKFTRRASKRRCVVFAVVWREPGVIIRRVLFAAGWREPGVVCYHI